MRDAPNYQLGEASSLLALPQNTLRNWMLGKRKMERILVPASRRPLELSFWNLVECSVLKSMRRVNQVSLQNIRTSLEFVRERMGKPRPLIEQTFQASGRHLFVEHFGKLVCVSQRGQGAIKKLLEATLRRIEWGADGLAQTLSPWHSKPEEPKVLSMDPRVAFGRAVLLNTSTPAIPVLQRLQAWESAQSVAEDFGLTRDQIDHLLRYFVPERAA